MFARKFFAIFQNRDFFDFFQFFENLKIYTSVRETGKNLEIFCREQNFPKNFFRRTGGRENPENPEISPPNSRLNDQFLPKFSPPGKSRNFPKFFGIFSTKSTVCCRFLLFERVKIWLFSKIFVPPEIGLLPPILGGSGPPVSVLKSSFTPRRGGFSGNPRAEFFRAKKAVSNSKLLISIFTIFIEKIRSLFAAWGGRGRVVLRRFCRPQFLGSPRKCPTFFFNTDDRCV